MRRWFDTRELTQAQINARVIDPADLQTRLGARAIGGGVLGVASQLIRMVLQIASTAILARLLAPEVFGLAAMAGTILALVTVLTDLNVSTITIQRADLNQQMASALLVISVGMGLGALAFAAIAAPIAAWLFHEERIAAVAIAMAATVPLGSLGNQHYALLTRNMRWVELNVASIASAALGAVVAVIAAWLFNASYWALVLQACTSSLTWTLAVWYFCPWRPSIVHDWSSAAASLKFGANITAAMLLNYLHRQLDNILIGSRWGAAELGYYARAYALLTTPLNLLSGPLASALLPALSRLQDEPAKWRNAYLDALAVVTMVGGGIACGLFGAAKPIVNILLGSNWDRTEVIFSLLCIGLIPSTAMSTVSWITLSSGRSDRMLLWGLIGVPIYVVAFVLGLPFGATGVALAYSMSRYVAFLPCFLVACAGTPITVRDVLLVVLTPFAAAALIGWSLRIVTAGQPDLIAAAATAAGFMVYVAAIAAAVWRLPIYQRLRQRALLGLASVRTRLPSQFSRQARD